MNNGVKSLGKIKINNIYIIYYYIKRDAILVAGNIFWVPWAIDSKNFVEICIKDVELYCWDRQSDSEYCIPPPLSGIVRYVDKSHKFEYVLQFAYLDFSESDNSAQCRVCLGSRITRSCQWWSQDISSETETLAKTEVSRHETSQNNLTLPRHAFRKHSIFYLLHVILFFVCIVSVFFFYSDLCSYCVFYCLLPSGVLSK